ncbi:MAG TPA: formate--phosphoribosylaminoimidazolecarboxamide ligase family protein [Candidatus Thermoplasmatota archaeon]|jgi:5-formaminoimidazole-4-carboxamide-1-(beta)-D-ribofuranosyl 5'-monophosphate synthetase|nr:formate--phosphoribosylaminoimidazolecarboxamide ligase family protein [Candidatus Thermoplasmatota archaeon]
MLDRALAQGMARKYKGKPSVAVVASHSALDIAEGAHAEGLRTIALCQRGRDAPYARYFRATKAKGERQRGFVDDALVLGKFSDLLGKDVLAKLRKARAVVVPNRALTSYLKLAQVEDDLELPIFGSRAMLRSEERGEQRDYYWLLERAGLPFPEPIKSPEDIHELAIVKLHHAEKRLERGFFTAASYGEYARKAKQLLKQGVITQVALDRARIERYVIGPVFNLNFFYSPLHEQEPIELLGIDWRFESSLDGHVRLPAAQQMSLPDEQAIPEYTVVGHNSATLRESLLPKAFEMAEKFVKASQEHYAPGILGPFCLQTCVDKDLNFWIYDVAPRIGGGTNVHMAVGHPYGNALWGRPMSTGRRIALELRWASAQGRLDELVT